MCVACSAILRAVQYRHTHTNTHIQVSVAWRTHSSRTKQKVFVDRLCVCARVCVCTRVREYTQRERAFEPSFLLQLLSHRLDFPCALGSIEHNDETWAHVHNAISIDKISTINAIKPTVETRFLAISVLLWFSFNNALKTHGCNLFENNNFSHTFNRSR